MTQLALFEDPAPVWRPAPGRNGCGRDPAAGPGTCWFWWEGCPRAKARGCHLLWLKERPR